MEEISKITPQDLNKILEVLVDRGYLPRKIKDSLSPDRFLDLFELVAERLDPEFDGLPESDKIAPEFWKKYLEADEIDKRHLTASLLDHAIPDITVRLETDTQYYSLVSIVDSYFKDLIVYLAKVERAEKAGSGCISGLA